MDCTPPGEWRLLSTLLTQARECAAAVSFRQIFKQMAWPVETGVLVLDAFDGARFASLGPFRDLIGGQRFEQLGPEGCALLLGLGLANRLGKLAQRVQRALEADSLQGNPMFGGGLGHDATDEVVGDEMGRSEEHTSELQS